MRAGESFEGVQCGPESSALPISGEVAVPVFASPELALRAYAIVGYEKGRELYFERLSTLMTMLEHPVARVAPVGALLVRDSDDGKRGVLCAEKTLDGGWRLTPEAT